MSRAQRVQGVQEGPQGLGATTGSTAIKPNAAISENYGFATGMIDHTADGHPTELADMGWKKKSKSHPRHDLAMRYDITADVSSGKK